MIINIRLMTKYKMKTLFIMKDKETYTYIYHDSLKLMQVLSNTNHSLAQ